MALHNFFSFETNHVLVPERSSGSPLHGSDIGPLCNHNIEFSGYTKQVPYFPGDFLNGPIVSCVQQAFSVGLCREAFLLNFSCSRTCLV